MIKKLWQGRADQKEEKSLSKHEMQDEVSFLRMKFQSLAMRGDYQQCINEIESNFSMLYEHERWPENFLVVLRLHKKCYPTLGKSQTFDEYMLALLKKHQIPIAFVALLNKQDSAIQWTTEYFENMVNENLKSEDAKTALGYAEIMIKMEPSSSDAFVIKGGVLEEMGENENASKEYEYALGLRPDNNRALRGLVGSYTKQNPKKALEYIDAAIEKSSDVASYYAMKSSVLQSMGDIDGAVEALDEASKLDPYEADYPYQKAEMYFNQDRKVLALPQYRMALAMNERHVPTLIRLAQFSYESQPKYALEYIDKLLSIQPDDTAMSKMRADLLQRTGQLDEAITQYEKILKNNSDEVEAAAGLASLYIIKEQADEALGYATKAVGMAPENTAYRLDKARAYQMLGQKDRAIKEYSKIIELDETVARAWGEHGMLVVDTKPEQALDDFTNAVKYDPESAKYHAGRARILADIPGREEEAAKSYDVASRLDPANAPLRYEFGYVLQKINNNASALQNYTAAIRIDPAIAAAHYQIATLLIYTHPQVALAHINNAISLNFTNSQYYFFKTRVLSELIDNEMAMQKIVISSTGDGNEEIQELNDLMDGNGLRTALMYINRAVELSPDNVGYLCIRAHLLYQMGQTNRARQQYESLLKSNPGQHEALFGMARICAGAKEQKEALEYFDKAIALAPNIAEYHGEKADFLSQNENAWEQSVEEYTKAINLDNQQWKTILSKAQLLDNMGNRNEAMMEYRRVLLLYPLSLKATERMAQLLAEISPYASLTYIDHAIELDAENVTYLVWKARILYNLGHNTEAMEQCDDAAEKGENKPEIYALLAEVLTECAPQKALAYSEKVVEIDPENSAYRLMCGDLYTATGQFQLAGMQYEKAVEINGKSHEALEKLAGLAYLQDMPDCLDRVEKALISSPDCTTCLMLKAHILDEQQGNTAAAIECVAKAIKLEPDSISYREMLVELLRKKRSFIRHALEKRSLEKLRVRLEAPAELLEPVDLTYEPHLDLGYTQQETDSLDESDSQPDVETAEV